MQIGLRLIRLVLIAGAFAGSSVAYTSLRRVPDDYSSIQAAVDAAASGDTVLLADGEYVEFVSLPCRNLTIAGEYLQIGDSSEVDQCRWYAPANSRHVEALTCTNETELSVIGISFHGASSGGLSLSRNRIFIRSCTFANCQANLGGAIRAFRADLRIEGSIFTECAAQSNGAVIYLDSTRCAFVSSRIESCAVQSTEGALFRLNARSASFNSSSLRFNNFAGERDVFQLSGGMDTLTINSCHLDSNRIRYAFRQPTGLCHVLSVSGTSVAHNSFSGGFLVDSELETGSATVFNCTFSENEAASIVVRALFFYRSEFAEFSFSHCLFSNNNWIDELLYLEFAGAVEAKHNYFIGNSSVPGILYPCVIYGEGPETTFVQNVFQDNAVAAIVTSFEPAFQAVNNYWGDPTGPYHAELNPQGLGDTVRGNVQFVPWSADTLFPVNENDFVPRNFSLGKPYPNPFNSSVTIEYTLARGQSVSLEIFDVLGRNVETLISGKQNSGVHAAKWNADRIASGLYFARLSSFGSEQSSRAAKLLLMK